MYYVAFLILHRKHPAPVYYNNSTVFAMPISNNITVYICLYQMSENVIQSMHSMSHYMKNQLQKLTACLRMNNFYHVFDNKPSSYISFHRCYARLQRGQIHVLTGPNHENLPGSCPTPPKCHTPRNQKRPYYKGLLKNHPSSLWVTG